MAKISKVSKNDERKMLVARYAKRRAAFKATIKDPKSSQADREAAQAGLQKLPRDASPIRVTLRCQVTGRPRGNLRAFGMSRITFRELALAGQIPGVIKASW